MTKLFISLFLLLALGACQNNKEKSKEVSKDNLENNEELKTVVEKIAYAYGYENWSQVESITFSFVVNPGEGEMIRKWSWYPKKNKVSLVNDNELITYERNNLMEEFLQTDKAFVNDSFWLLFPFQLVWGNFNYNVEENAKTPIYQRESTKLIVKYHEKGGYTPGDRYDVYINENYHILEWAYYPSGQDEPALINTFEDLSNFNGIKINMIHRNPETGFQLNFRDVSIN